VIYYLYMSKLLQEAISEITNLPEADQEEIGRRLLSHIEKLRRLRAEIEKGIRSLDRGEGRELDIEEFIQQMHVRHGRG
jgi:Arc/MetJ-type ribon-helix-helix transcriptional regulator